MNEHGKIHEPVVYIPDNAKLNVENTPLDAPKTKYEDRKKIIDREELDKAIKHNKYDGYE